VASLLERRILEPVGKDGHVYLGRQLYFLGQAHLRHFDLSREADHALQEIVSQTHETAQMCLLNGRKYTVALMKEGERHFRISSDIGENAPIPWTASGRLLLAHLSDQAIIDLIDHDDFILPDGERLPLEQFLKEIRQAGIDGFFLRQRRRHLYPLLRRPGQRPQRRGHRDPVHRRPRADAKKITTTTAGC
jgi:DNA-binding IclR family transcriptional regulator